MISLGPDPEGATPLTDEDFEGLIPEHVTTRGELNEVEFEFEFEFDNIVRALSWAQAERTGPTQPISGEGRAGRSARTPRR